MSNDISQLIDSIDISKFDNTTSFLEEVHRLQQEHGNVSKVEFGKKVTNNNITDQRTLSIVVRKLLKIEEELKVLNERARPLRKLKTELRKEIARYMGNRGHEELNLPPDRGGGYLVYQKRKKRINPLTKRRLPIFVRQYFRQTHSPAEASKLAEELMKYIEDHAKHEDTETLKRIK